MIDQELSIPIVLGAAFATVYWVADAAATALSGIGETVFLVLTVAMIAVWALLAASILSPDPRRTTDFTEEILVLGLYWAALFGGTAVVVTVAFSAVAMVIWPAGVARTFWFGTILVSTVVVGIVAITLGGVARREGLSMGV